MLSINSGGKFPCTIGSGLSAASNSIFTCIFEEGSADNTNGLGTPMRIHVINFSYTANTLLKLCLLITNPPSISKKLKVGLKAFVGTPSNEILTG